jgi:uncharacterized protein with PIN domain
VDDASLLVSVTSVILERPTCLLCVAAKVGESTLSVERTVDRIGKTMTVHIANNERCHACGRTLGPVYSLTRR